MQSGKASGEHGSPGDTPGAGTADAGRPKDADLRALLDFFDRERRRSQRSALTAGAVGAVVGALAILGANAAGWIQVPAKVAGGDGVGRRLSELEESSGSLSAQMRALVSQPHGAPSNAPTVAPTPSVRKESSDAAIAGKPSGTSLDERERANRVGDDSVARALEHARDLANPANASRATLPEQSPPPAVKSEKSEGASPPAIKVEDLAPSPPDPLLAAFNTLMADCGIDRWYLISAEPAPDDHALRRVVLVHRNPSGTAVGSLTADRLTLERDAASGVAAFVLSGARQNESGVEEAFPNGTTRLEIPGILPLQLVPPELATLFGTAASGAIGKSARFDPADAAQVTRAINRVLELEKEVALRVRSVEKFSDDRLEKAVIDLLYDDHGQPRQTVYADHAWFEIDPKHDSAELCCEGGEMVVDGSRRPLFRGRLRWPIYSVSPAQWLGMPSLKHIAGS